ncbi:MAG: hypothetical protein KDJ99_15455, partial [Candidatus Competibacteraceae bacterium]|nr:hypothetical protein [Candidatus Competibacteraceae bacterium]
MLTTLLEKTADRTDWLRRLMACLWLIGLLRIFYHGDWLGHIALVGMLVYLLLAWPLCGRLNRIVTLVVSAIVVLVCALEQRWEAI